MKKGTNNSQTVKCAFSFVGCTAPGLSIGDLGSVTAIRMDIRLLDIYIVNGKPYYYYNFRLLIFKENQGF